MSLSFEKLYKYTDRNIRRALGEAELLREATAMTVEFPGYTRLRPGDYETGDFVTLFLDMRGSTIRAATIGAKNTFVTMQALLPSLGRIVNETEGFVVDFPGDGIMAHWDMADNAQLAILKGVEAACWMDDCVRNIVNPLLQSKGIPPLVCAIGVAAGTVIITKLGIPDTIVAKAIGDSVNRAAKLTNAAVNSGKILLDLEMANRVYIRAQSENDVLFRYSIEDENTVAIEATQKLKLPRERNSLLSTMYEVLSAERQN